MFSNGIPLLVVGRWKYEEGGRPALTTPQGVLFSWMGSVFVSESGGVFEAPTPDGLLRVLPVLDARWFLVLINNEVL